MRTKEYLGQIRKAKIIIEQKKTERRELIESLTGISAATYDEDKVTTSASHDAPFAALVERCIELDEEIERSIQKYIDLREKIVGQIQAMPRTEYIDLLHKRYAEGKSLELISVEMNYSFNWVRHMHGLALQAFEKVYGEEYK